MWLNQESCVRLRPERKNHVWAYDFVFDACGCRGDWTIRSFVDEAVAETKKIRPGRAYLTHIGHEASHRELIRFLPTGIEPAHDGLRLRDRREPN